MPIIATTTDNRGAKGTKRGQIPYNSKHHGKTTTDLTSCPLHVTIEKVLSQHQNVRYPFKTHRRSKRH